MRTSDTRSRGFSLLEVLIAAALMSMLLLAIYAIAEMLSRSQIVTEARAEARQAVRTGTNRFIVSGSGAKWFFRGANASEGFTLNGISCRLPWRNTTGTWVPGDSVAVAVPNDLTRPVNDSLDPLSPTTPLYPVTSANARPDGFPDHDYSVVVMTTTEARQDSRSARQEGARDLVVMRWDAVTPATPGLVSSIDLTRLRAPTSVARYDAFLKPLNQNGFQVNYLEQPGQPVAACRVTANFRNLPRQGAAQEESYEFIFTTRN